MLGQMMRLPLLVSGLLRHADLNHGDTEIVSRLAEGGVHRYNYHEAHRRARRLARALASVGVAQSDRIGTLAWNTHRHFEVYFAASGMGAVCHTINPRLFPEQIAYIINHAEDSHIFVDVSFAHLVEVLAPRCQHVKTWVALCDREHLPECAIDLVCYEELLAARDDDFDWPELDENSASSLCYTSGTTGNPKGVLYSHRSTVLHAFAASLPDSMALSARDTACPVVPMFHVNAWGIPYAAAMVGCRLVLPGSHLDGHSLHDLFETEKVTFTAGVPTIWLGLLQYLEVRGLRLTSLKRLLVGGAAAPPRLIETLQSRYGLEVRHAWGMTEMSPLGAVSTLRHKHLSMPEEARNALQFKQGRPMFGVEMKVVDAEGQTLPRDGRAFGDLMVRGQWVMNDYFEAEGEPVLRDGWFPTGDVATIDADGYMQITDRSKDMIKSGGEWISSIDLENLAMGHPAIAESAVIGVRHPKWGERPLLVVVLKDGEEITKEELIAYMGERLAKWCLPDDVAIVDELPHTGTGKLSKVKLREQFLGYRLPTA
jgi:3-(methylthio)propionyl---CoA ligase